jgi:Domain of unknown function (DUF4129)
VRRAVIAVALAALALAPAAVATDASWARVATLAARARGDPAALAELRSIDRVDGRPMDLGAALAGASGEDLHERLRVLARTGAQPKPSIASPRDAAAEIVAQRKYRGSGTPRPLRGPLVWLRDRLDGIGRPIDWLAGIVPGGPPLLWALLAALVVVAAAAAATRTARRRVGAGRGLVERRRGVARLDPARLEREADAAERNGDLELALRLRFRAGLLRLARAGIVPDRASLTSAEARRLVRMQELDQLARTFDEVVYGGRPPRHDDVEAARRTWPLVVDKVAAR